MFSLNNYLNESLQSSKLYFEILNEPGGLFKYFQVLPREQKIDNIEYTNNHTLIGDAQAAISDIRDICHEVFNTYDVPRETNKYYPIKNTLSLQAIKNYNKLYNEAIKKYLYAMQHIFDKPNPRVFGEFVANGYNVDLFNITDDNFKKLTYKQCREMDKGIFDEMLSSERYTIFWFSSATNQLLAITRGGKILQFGTQAVDTDNYDKRHYFPVQIDRLKQNTDAEYLIDYIRTDVLDDGTELHWPHTTNNQYGDKQYGFNFINRKNLILPRNGSGRYTPYVIGNPFVNTSPIRNKVGWTKDDYIIIYMPESFMIDSETGTYKNVSFHGNKLSYNDWKSARGEGKRQRQIDYVQQYKKYKWQYDNEGKIIPYTIDGQKYLYDFDENGKTIVTPVESTESYADAFNMEFRKKNVEHYRYLIKQKSSNKEVIIFSKAVKDFSSKTLSYLDKIEEFENKVDLSKRIDGNFNDRIQRAINNILYTISRMKYTLEDFEKYTKEYESSNEDERTEANITNGIQRYMKWLKNQSDEINNEYEILDEIFNSEELKKIIEK